MSISTVILTKNEEKNIERALRSVEFCCEIIIIDDYSEDETIQRVKGEGLRVKSFEEKIKIFRRHLGGDFAGQRNYAMQQTKGEWILFVDADEIVSDELRNEIINVVHQNFQPVAYYLRRRDFFWRREMQFGETKKTKEIGIIRLVKKNSGKWAGKVHEEFKPNGSVGRLSGFLDHYPHQTIKEFLQEVNYYSSVRAKELFDRGKKTNIFEILCFPLAKFVLTYFIMLGFLDGPAGFTYAFFMSFHSFLVRTKLFQYNMKHVT